MSMANNPLQLARRILTAKEVERLKPLIEEIGGAANLLHVNSTLLEHLLGTWKILHRSGCSKAVCLAGLIHSIYSTEFYPHCLVCSEDRSRVQSIVGSKSERLAYLFCKARRADLQELRSSPDRAHQVQVQDHERLVTVTRIELEQLFQIECANYIEQCCADDGAPAPFMAWYQDLGSRRQLRVPPFLTRGSHKLTEADERFSAEIYRRILSDRVESADILEACRRNPFSGEILLLSALFLHREGEARLALEYLDRAAALLQDWGTSWDKRLSVQQWIELIWSIKCRLKSSGAQGCSMRVRSCLFQTRSSDL